MISYLDRLAARSRDELPRLTPRARSRFEPAELGIDPVIEVAIPGEPSPRPTASSTGEPRDEGSLLRREPPASLPRTEAVRRDEHKGSFVPRRSGDETSPEHRLGAAIESLATERRRAVTANPDHEPVQSSPIPDLAREAPAPSSRGTPPTVAPRRREVGEPMAGPAAERREPADVARSRPAIPVPADPSRSPITADREAQAASGEAERPRPPGREPRVEFAPAQARDGRGQEPAGAARDAFAQDLPHPVAPPAEPVIEISIGRIEVKAATPPASVRRPAPAPTPRLGLDDYMARRRGRRG